MRTAHVVCWQELPRMLRSDIMDLFFLSSYEGVHETLHLRLNGDDMHDTIIMELISYIERVSYVNNKLQYVVIEDYPDYKPKEV